MINMQKKEEAVENNLFSQEIEKSILACLLVSEDCHKYIKNLDEDDFYIFANKIIFNAIKNLYDNKQNIDVVLVNEALKKEQHIDLDYLISITDSFLTSATIEQNINILKNYSVKRKLKIAARKILERVNSSNLYDDSIELKNDCMKEIIDIKANRKIDVKSMQEVMTTTTQEIEKNYKNRDDFRYQTGFFDLDKLTNGLHEQELTVIAARPGVGKTSIALNIAENIATNGVKVCFMSLEMSDKQLGNRLISSRSGIDSHILRCGWLDNKDFEKISQTAIEIAELNIVIDDKSSTIQEIENKAIELKDKYDIGILIIDYLQLVTSKNKFDIREREVAEISRKLKLLSKDLNIPIIALCQLNRETEKRKRPILADLRESGAIEQDADNVIFLYADDEEKTKSIMEVSLIIAKQRNGPTGEIKLRYNRKTMKFMNRG